MKHTKPSNCGTSPQAQTATLRSIPKTTSGHKDPKVQPVGTKAGTGGKTK